MKIIYVGSFPPPYGGVTIKNVLIYKGLQQRVKITKINLGDIKKFKLKELFRFCSMLVNPTSVFIIGASAFLRKLLSGILFYFNRKALNRSLLFVMGGIFTRSLEGDFKYIRWLKEYKQIYVETDGMKTELNDKGIINVSVFPNCREKPVDLNSNKGNYDKPLRLLFFSQISKEKGADVALAVAKLLITKNIKFSMDFYGHIKKSYESEFKEVVGTLKSVNYQGVYQADDLSVYSKLQEYDVLLLPTKWKAEGVPGILVEAKIAGLPAIVSDINYNSEIVEHGKTGYIFKELNPNQIANLFKVLDRDRGLLDEMKGRVKASSEKYLIENYIDGIVKEIIGENHLVNE